MVSNGPSATIIVLSSKWIADFSHNPADLQRLYEACKYQGGDV